VEVNCAVTSQAMPEVDYSLTALHTAGLDSSIGGGPIGYSTFSFEGVRQLVAPHYDCHELTGCLFLNRGVNDTYLLSSHNRHFALRVLRSNWRNCESIMLELDALRHLSGKGIAVAMPVPRRDGGWITEVQAPEGMRRAVLFEWVSGRNPRYTNEIHSAQYGRLVGRLHDASDDIPRNPAYPVMNVKYLLDEPLARIRARLSGLREIAGRLEGLEERLRHRLSDRELQSLNWGFCHGDLLAGNAHVHRSQVVLLDFEFCGFGWRVYDLASYRWQARCKGVEKHTWNAFADAYLQVRPEMADELRMVPLFMILRHLWVTSKWIQLSAEMGVTLWSDDDVDDLVPFCERIEAESA